jgi:hypothetical protein
MALPDSIAFTGANQATLNAGTFKEVGIGADSPLFFRKVGGD